MGENLSRHIGDAFYRLMEAFLAVIPAVLVLAMSLTIGIVVGLLVRALLKGIFRLTHFGERKSPGASGEILKAAGVRANPAQVASTISFWAAVVVALVVGVDALEPSGLKNALTEAVSFLPRILTAALLLVVGLGLATVARRSILLAAVNAGLPWARTVARFVHVIVLVFFGATALDHLGVARSILVAAFSIVAGGLVLAVSLAFGLGARDLARSYLEKRLRAEEEDSGIRHV